jgi:hypothetical protein
VLTTEEREREREVDRIRRRRLTLVVIVEDSVYIDRIREGIMTKPKVKEKGDEKGKKKQRKKNFGKSKDIWFFQTTLIPVKIFREAQ